MTNAEKIAKVSQQHARAKELYEMKYNKADWDAKKPEAIKYYKKCIEIAAKEIWGF